MQAQETSITSGVNEARFLDHLRTMFSTSTTVIAECMQNARRAGASSVFFDYNEEMASLIITDSGCGIADFTKLITVAESGWSQEVQDSERPFGIGFFSVSFAAETVVVESRGNQIVFSSEDLIAKRQISVQPSSFIGGTRITLQKCKLDSKKVGEALQRFAKGFSIPVIWQGEELPRPHALANLAGVSTPVGFIHVPGIHDARHLGVFNGLGIAYCQGLPVDVSGFSRRWDEKSCPIVHVDHRKYQPRMPDRDSLIDSDQASKDFSSAIGDLWRLHLEEQKTVLSPEAFVETYWVAAMNARLLDIMNDVPVLPKSKLSVVGETPIQMGDGDGEFMYRNKVHVTQVEVETGAVQLCHDLDYDGEGDEFAKLMFAQKAGLVFVDFGLPEKHWAQPFIRNLSKEKVKVGGKVIDSAEFSGNFTSGTVKLVEKLMVTIAGKTFELTEPLALGSDAWGSERTFLVPKGVTSAGYVLRQASTYIDGDNNSYCSTDFDLDSDKFDDLVAILAGEQGVETLSKCLSFAGARNKSSLRNNAYLVRFDESGNVTIEAAA